MVEKIPYEEKDYLEISRERYTLAFEDKPVFDGLIQLITLQLKDIDLTLKDLMQLRTLEEASGVQLDIIGSIVGQPRLLVEADFMSYFGMEGNIRSEAMGDLNTTSGGMFYNLGEKLSGNIALDNETYRIMLRAKIAKNATRATPEEFMAYLNYVFGTTASFTSESNAQVIALINADLTPQQIMLPSYINRSGSYDVTLFPKPIGVGIRYGFYTDEQNFAFDEVLTAKGFGDLFVEVDGGIFSSLLTNT